MVIDARDRYGRILERGDVVGVTVHPISWARAMEILKVTERVDPPRLLVLGFDGDPVWVDARSTELLLTSRGRVPQPPARRD